MDSIFRSVWEMSLFAIPVIILLAVLSGFLGKRYGAKWRYLLWLVVAVRLCIPVQLTLPEPMLSLRMEVPSLQNGAREVLETKNPDYLAESDSYKAMMQEALTPSPDEATHYMLHVDLTAAEHDIDMFDLILAYPDMLWLMGVLAFLGWQQWKYSSFKRMLKRNRRKVMDAEVLDIFYTLCRDYGMKNRPELYVCESLPSPLCIGLFYPDIYINGEDREPDDLRLILKHELTHCKRKDLWMKRVLMLARAMHFFNPFVHWMAKLAEKDMELSCDMAVMENCGMAEREAYSMAILRTVRESKQKNSQMTTAFSGGKEELKARFENIFDMTKKKRGIALFTAAAVLVCGGTAFVGCTAPEPKEGPAYQGVVYGDYTEELVHQLYEAKLEYIGDAVGVRELFSLFPMPKGVVPHVDGLVLETKKVLLSEGVYQNTDEPYGAIFHLQGEENEETVYHLDGGTYLDDRCYRIHGLLFLTLVENAGYQEYMLYQGDAGIGMHWDREWAGHYFGETDLRDFAKDEATFRNFVLALNRYFYEGIDTPEEIEELLALDAEAAQERMNEMLYGVPATETTDRSMSYQMIHADSLVYELARELEQGSDSDFRDMEKYQEIIAIGEPAVREFLAKFAEGHAGDGIEGEIMMAACQDILGTDFGAGSKPTEWYWLYASLDSMLLPSFRYDEGVYETDTAVDWSICAAGQDERLRAVYDALTPEEMTLGHEVTFVAPYIHHIDEKKTWMKVYTRIYESTFVLTRTNEGYGLFKRGGSNIPTRLDFQKKDGEWVLVAKTIAKDGDQYVDSIKQMCGNHWGLADKMIEGGNTQELMWQNIIYYMKAHFDGADIPIYTRSHMDADDLKYVNEHITVIPLYEE